MSEPAEDARGRRVRIGELLTILLCMLSVVVGAILVVKGGRGAAAASSRGEWSAAGMMPFGPPGIGVVRLDGVISFEEESGTLPIPSFSVAERVLRALHKAGRIECVKAVVLRVNSPGGTVAASQEIAGAVEKLSASGKPVVVSMGDVAASGGYYVSAPADYIMADPGTITGSIGVIATFPYVEELLGKIGVSYSVIKSGRFKDMGSMFRKMEPQERELFRKLIMDAYDQFVGAVVSGRVLEKDGRWRKAVLRSREDVLKLADGRVFSGREALKVGLVDELGGYYDAVAKAAEMAGLGGNPPVYPLTAGSALEMFLGMMEGKLGFLRPAMVVRMGSLSGMPAFLTRTGFAGAPCGGVPLLYLYTTMGGVR